MKKKYLTILSKKEFKKARGKTELEAIENDTVVSRAHHDVVSSTNSSALYRAYTLYDGNDIPFRDLVYLVLNESISDERSAILSRVADYFAGIDAGVTSVDEINIYISEIIGFIDYMIRGFSGDYYTAAKNIQILKNAYNTVLERYFLNIGKYCLIGKTADTDNSIMVMRDVVTGDDESDSNENLSEDVEAPNNEEGISNVISACTVTKIEIDEYISNVTSSVAELGYLYVQTYSNIINALTDDFSIAKEIFDKLVSSDELNNMRKFTFPTHDTLAQLFGLDIFESVVYTPHIQKSLRGVPVSITIDNKNACYTVTEFKAKVFYYLIKALSDNTRTTLLSNSDKIIKTANQNLDPGLKLIKNTKNSNCRAEQFGIKTIFTKKQMETIMKLHDDGVTWAELADRFCVSLSLMDKIVREYRKVLKSSDSGNK